MTFRERIEIWQTSTVSDGFGGNEVISQKITESWANIQTMGINSKYASISSSEGVGSSSNGIVVRARKRSDITYNKINQFIKHKGVSYMIQSEPVNVDFQNKIIEFVAVRNELKTVSELNPIA